MAGALLWGYDATNKVWIPLQVDANGYVKVDLSNINLDDLANVDTSGVADGDLLYYDSLSGLWIPYKVTGDSLSQTFGASATRLRNIIPTPLAGEILRITNCAGCAFSGLIDDTPAAHGGQGLDSTHVPYDGDTYEDMFNGLFAYDGSAYWGQIILHNTTRGNSRKIVSVDRATNTITTTNSVDDWANNDAIDCESQTVDGGPTAEYVDIDVSDFVGTGVDAIMLFVAWQNNTAGGDIQNSIYFHPYETFNAGKRIWVAALLANEQSSSLIMVPVISQKITFCAWQQGTNDNYIVLTVKGTIEYADT